MGGQTLHEDYRSVLAVLSRRYHKKKKKLRLIRWEGALHSVQSLAKDLLCVASRYQACYISMDD